MWGFQVLINNLIYNAHQFSYSWGTFYIKSNEFQSSIGGRCELNNKLRKITVKTIGIAYRKVDLHYMYGFVLYCRFALFPWVFFCAPIIFYIRSILNALRKTISTFKVKLTVIAAITTWITGPLNYYSCGKNIRE